MGDSGSTWSVKLTLIVLKSAYRWPRWRPPCEILEVSPEARHRCRSARGRHAGSEYSRGSVSRT